MAQAQEVPESMMPGERALKAVRRILPVPPAVDLTDGFPFPPANQAPYGSCTACAAAGIYSYHEHQAYGRAVELSPRFLYYVTRLLMKAPVGAGYDGLLVHKVMQTLVTVGVTPEEFWPYKPEDLGQEFTTEPPAFVYALAGNYRAEKYERLDATGVEGEDPDEWAHPEDLLANVKRLLSQKNPLMFGTSAVVQLGSMSINDALMDFAFTKTPGGMWPAPTDADIALFQKVEASGEQDLTKPTYVMAHVMVACGYDDNKEVHFPNGTSAGKGALRVRNSWSPDWGDHGYGWLPYSYVLNQMTEDWWCLRKTAWTANQADFTR